MGRGVGMEDLNDYNNGGWGWDQRGHAIKVTHGERGGGLKN